MFPVNELKKWFLKNRRFFPWRDDRDPYKVWISEIMLQQTQASVVNFYFKKWMKAFPTIRDLAEASLEAVLKTWEGLGYYTRARNLHQAARQVVHTYGGRLPQNLSELLKIQGIGPYTAGAILSFAFLQKAAAVDGNVVRVLSRYFVVQEKMPSSLGMKKIWKYAEALLPEKEPWLVTEGLIELGALVCKKKPLCQRCPLKNSCLAFARGIQEELPQKKPPRKTIFLERDVGVIVCQGRYLVRQEKGSLMQDLYEFPYFKREGAAAFKTSLESLYSLSLHYLEALPSQRQSFTHHRLLLFPHVFSASHGPLTEDWKSKEELLQLPFSSGHRKIWHSFIDREALC